MSERLVMQDSLDFGRYEVPLVVCYGMGRDSTAMLIGFHQRSIRPDLILFADVGAERKPTYDYLAVINPWLRSVGFPEVVVVRYQPKNYKHWPPYYTIEENILTNIALPSIAYGGHNCSVKWKIEPQNAYIKQWQPALACWSNGKRVSKAIGFEDSPHELRRSARGCATFAVQDDEKDKFDIWYPLQQWHWNLERCITEIQKAGLPVPPKSSCYFCTAMKPWEVAELATLDPDKLRRIVIVEARTVRRHLDYAEEKGWPAGEGVPLTHGLWRKPVKGMRGATPRPGSMTQFIKDRGLLPAAEIDRLVELTPTRHFSKADFDRLGISGWQDWIGRICEEARNPKQTTP
jgi:hypothetical protein